MNRDAARLAVRPAGLRAPLWDAMDRRPRHGADTALRTTAPCRPGVYAWYREGNAVYVGEGDNLQKRIWTRHMGQSRSHHTSSLRRNIAEHLGFGDANLIYTRVIRLTDEQRAAVRAWLVGCQVAWIECDSDAEAHDLESRMKAEWLPPLTKR